MRLYEVGVPYQDLETNQMKTEFGYAVTAGRLTPWQAPAFWRALCARYKGWMMFPDLGLPVRYLKKDQPPGKDVFVYDAGSIDSMKQLDFLREALDPVDMTDFPVAISEPALWYTPAPRPAKQQPAPQQPSRARPRLNYTTKTRSA